MAYAAKPQAQLLRFLSTELNSAFITLRTAEVDTGLDLDSRIAVLAKFGRTLRIVRRLEKWVDDVIIAAEIKARAIELESALIALATKWRIRH
jgi:D-ribose pyranose/furanose isomerase RbsD